MNEFTKDLLRVMASIFLGLLSVFIILKFINPGQLRLDVQSTAHPEARTISVTGEGIVVVKPDIAKINISVVSEEKTVDKVTKDNNEKMNGIINKIKEIGISADDITTASYYLNPVYTYPENQKPVISGYRLEQTLALKIRNLDLVDDVIDQSTTLGANNVYGLTFTLDDDKAANDEARDKAFADAKAKAEKMAASAGVKLGRVYTFSEGYGPTPAYPIYAADYMKSSVSAAETVIEPGSQDIMMNVNVTYELE